jgi:hypothetical protein
MEKVPLLVVIASMMINHTIYAQAQNAAASLAAYRSICDSGIGEFIIDTDVVYVLPPDAQRNAAACFDGTYYMCVWMDDRRGYSMDIYGTRIDQMGTQVDPGGIVISDGINEQNFPAVAFDGNHYFIVWQDNRSGNFDIYGSRVNQTGVVLDSAGIPISTASYDQSVPSAGFDGTNFLVVWSDGRNGQDSDIYGARVSQFGVVLDTAGIAISSNAHDQSCPSVAFDGTNFLVVWQDVRSGHVDIYGARISPLGFVIDTIGIPIADDPVRQASPALTFGNTCYLVAWEDRRSGEDDIYGVRVDASGSIIDTNSIAISTAIGGQWDPVIAFDGMNYFVAWMDTRISYCDIYGSRVSQSGIVLDTSGVAISTATDVQLYPAITFGGTDYLAIWQDRRTDFEYDIYGARISQVGSVIDSLGFIIATSANSQNNPAVSSNGADYLVVWEDTRRDSFFDIYARRVDQFGANLDSLAIRISAHGDNQRHPAIAFGGTGYFIVWENHFALDIYGARVALTGTVIDTVGISISSSSYMEYDPSVAYGNDNYLVAWQDSRSIVTGPDIYGARVNLSGVVLDTVGIAISTFYGYDGFPCVASSGTDFLVAWQDSRSLSTAPDIYCARVNQSGTVLDPGGIALSIAPYDQRYPSVSFDGTNFLVVWQDHRNGNWDIYGSRITPSGTVLDPSGIAISNAEYSQLYPCVIFDGTEYLVVWADSRTAVDLNIYGARLDTTGAVVDSFIVSQRFGRQTTPALARGTENQGLIAYSGWTSRINAHLANSMRIWGVFSTDIGIEEMKSHVAKLNLHIYPNPIRHECEIKYVLSQESTVNLAIYDATGRLINTIISENQTAGIHTTRCKWVDLPQGVYFVRLHDTSQSEIQKVIFLK